MDAIWDKWRELYKEVGIDTGRICKDGIICYEAFCNSKPKILFVMKDINNRGVEDHSHGVRDLPEWLKDGPRHQLWHTIARWSAGIFNEFPPYKTLNKDVVKGALTKVAAINLKKACGGARVDSKVIAAYAHQDRDLLLEQIQTVKPDLIIACGVMEHLIWLLDLKVNPEDPKDSPVKDTARGAWVVPFRHPARAAGSKIYCQLKQAVSTVYKNGILTDTAS
ncbi:MAG: hypothetical protein HQL14_07020 [Candidatus Omnitrophica bacterium]|nr:hypothetical protein [Candidatus Omnitrophota bacterium]